MKPFRSARNCAPARTRVLIPQDVLGIDVRLALVDLDHIVASSRVDLSVVFISPVAVPEYRFCDHCPSVRM
jgi:hypothetical protein